jgi:nucleotide-binding universal stress UspA family protein
MYKKVLVPLDGSQFAECVLDHVKSIASGCRVSEVVLLFVLEPLPGVTYEVPAEWLDEGRKQGLDFGKQYLKKISDDLSSSGIMVSSVVLSGVAAETILSYAQANGIDLIAISTHGRSGLTRWMFGSVADKVIHQSSIPVLIVSPPGCRVSNNK